jgi:hypothetical protein
MHKWIMQSRYCLYIWSTWYVRIHKAVQLRSKLQHTGTWSAESWPPHRLCYRPTVFLPPPHIIALAFPQGKIWPTFKNVIYPLPEKSLKAGVLQVGSVCSLVRYFRNLSLTNHDDVRRLSQPLLAHHLPRSWARGGAVGWSTALQTWRCQARFTMVSLEFFIDIILPAAPWPWCRLSL